MQNPSTPSLQTFILWAIATPILSALSALISHLLTRPKQSAEIHKTEAEAQEIQSSIMMKVYGRLDDYEDKRKQLNNAIADLENRNFDLEYAGRQKDAEIKRLKEEIGILNFQVDRAKASGFLEERAPHSPNPAATPTS